MNVSASRLKNPILPIISKNILISAVGSILSYLVFVYAATMFGASSGTDVFFFATSFVVSFTGLVTTVFGAVLLPLYVRYLHDPFVQNRAINFANALYYRILLIAIFGAVLIILYPVELFSVVSKFDLQALANHEAMLRYFSAIYGLTLLCEFLRILLQAHEKFVSAALSVVILSATNLFSVVLFQSKLGYESLAVGACISRLLQAAFLLWQVRVNRISLKISFKENADVKEFLSVGWPYWLASIVTMLALFSLDYAASGLPRGNLTAVAYAQKIYMMPLAFIAMPIFDVLNTRMSVAFASGDMDGLRLLYIRSLKLALFIAVPLSIIMAIDSGNISAVLLGHGVYNIKSQLITAQSLTLYSLTIPLMVIFSINGRIPVVFHQTRMPSFYGSIGYIILIVVGQALVYSFGYIGIPAAKLLLDFVYFLPFGFIVARIYISTANYRTVLIEAGIVSFACVVASGISIIFSDIAELMRLPQLLELLASSGCFLIVYLFISWTLGADSIKLLRSSSVGN